jgi:gamma-glutamyl hercynylcysteine S-oxide synthase
MSAEGIAARFGGNAELERAMRDAHARTWAVLADLTPDQWRVPYHAGINPPLWEYAHVAWFTEWWVLRDARWMRDDVVATSRPSMLPGADRWFDSSRVAHVDRWTLGVPPLTEIRDYARAVHESVLAKLCSTGDDLYPFRLALFHEDMHGEALAWMRQTLDYPPPRPLAMPSLAIPNEDIAIDVGEFVQGSPRDEGFVFDNEKWAHGVALAPYHIATCCVSNAAYADFVDAGGYRESRWWSDEGCAWLREARVAHPQRWRHAGDGWEQRWFGSWQPLIAAAPVCHVNAYEAEAYCRFARRRLPTEAEWECAATLGAIAWGGSVWEWTADAFAPYPGFSADRYRDYSQPWFGTHRSLRGGSLATQSRLTHRRYRNFFLAHRNDIFAGFRTCAAADL